MNSIILDGTIVPPGVHIPDNSVFGGKPAQFVNLVPDNHKNSHINNLYLLFRSIMTQVNEYELLRAKRMKEMRDKKLKSSSGKKVSK